MLDFLKQDTDVLFYNVFGFAEIGERQIKVTANIVRAGRNQSRVIAEEFSNPLKAYTADFIIPFGAWLENGEAHIAFGSLDEYNQAVVNANILKVEDVIKRTVELFKGALE